MLPYGQKLLFPLIANISQTRMKKQGRQSHGATTAPVTQTVRGQHGGNRLPFLPELHFEICTLFTGIGIYNYF
jgi:hypothetical protein